ncbi:MAG TPA: hypothetical protein VHZ99_12655, partial [Steroidobacteraceae bacterium]|nr:hypothetical protein [Steroidobacteraceae bacterium]
MKTSVFGGLCTASLVMATAIATPASAGEAAADANKSTDSLQEIVVTAERRSENLMDVPLAISAQTDEQLADKGIKDITDLQFTTPGFNVSDSSG